MLLFLVYLIYLVLFSYAFAVRGYHDGAIGRPDDVDWFKAHIVYWMQTDIPAISVGLGLAVYKLFLDFTPKTIGAVIVFGAIAAMVFSTIFDAFYKLGEKHHDKFRVKKEP